ncbi:uncharacterized protein CDV56_102436 [Aspergillus thermomutatus]|uniref:Uncharacterized protein n=1 Tax=Aspergillus thermomutatus TaxID=41047 RepID=A0A397FXH4_ASPTH|nr:uncharacterized protein CDV56_102436 [Aspergillus thermomutatus]RHZ43461.1 hypothetical protein CDV56_102436 [Aspergillus thermomutatus]
MIFSQALVLLACLPYALGTSLIDFSAARGDDPSILGIRNLEAARDDKVSANTDDLYIKLGTDPRGTSALHFHRIQGDIRAEYHSLPNKVAADQTYYIGYQLSLGEIEESLMIWQFKEYAANNAEDGGANIPLSLEFKNGVLNLQYQASSTAKRESQWSRRLQTNTVYSIGLVINTATPGWVELYFDGEKQTFSTTGTTRLPATTFPGRAEPKFGAYRGEAVGIDTYVYRIQIGTALKDIQEAAGLGQPSTSTSTRISTTMATRTSTTRTTTRTTSSAPTSTATCEWTGHCAGATCSNADECSDPWTCFNGVCNYDPTVTCAVCANSDGCSDPWACISGKCAVDPSITCSWEGHCAGATCVMDDDCDDPWACVYGVCAIETTA